MARNTYEFPSYQIFRQKRGEKSVKFAQPLVELHDERDVPRVLAMLRKQEEADGRRCIENGNGGFTAYVGDVKKDGARSVYWSELVMTDEAINSENSPICQNIAISVGIAMLRGAIRGRAMREAVVAGINFEPDEDAL